MPKTVDIAHLFTPPRRPKKPGAFKITDAIVADALNRGTVKSHRNLDKKDYLIHVSDLIKTEKAWEFCAREHVFHYHSTRAKVSGGSLSPGRELLFATGHFLGDYVVRKFVRNSPFAKYAYGLWTCNCPRHPEDGWEGRWPGKKYLGLYGHLSFDNVCKHCNAVNDNYREIDLISRKFGLIGHADLLLRYAGKFIVYEFKSIDRTDIDFDSINQPFFDHRMQASFYYYILRELEMDVSPFVRVLYIDRSNKKLLAGEPYKEFKVRVASLQTVTEYTDKLNALNTGKKSGFLPTRICQNIRASRAKSCDHAIECFERRGQYAKPGEKVTLAA
jgi:hypothetical protein